MVNVHIHQFQPSGAVVDTAAFAQFQEQWATYRKLVESDCLAHREDEEDDANEASPTIQFMSPKDDTDEA